MQAFRLKKSAPGNSARFFPFIGNKGHQQFLRHKLWLVVVLALAGCGGGGGGSTPTPPPAPSTPSISIAPSSVTEGNIGTSSLIFTITLSAATTNPVVVNYVTSDGTALAASDYVATNGILTIAAGATTGTVAVPVHGDTLVEPDETLTLTLSAPTNATIATATATGTILNDDTAPVKPSISIAPSSVTEGNIGTSNLIFTITLSAATTNPVVVNYATSDGTALAASDYVATNGILTIAAGATSGTVTVPVNGDTLVEPDETLTLTLSAPTNATIATAAATGTILNDDVAAPVAANQALLGPLSGATIKVYRLTNLATPVESVVANNSTTNLNLAGSFALTLAGIPATEWILVTATGGQDIDANDDGVIDAVASANTGTIHALATAADWKANSAHISILTELAWQGVQAAVTAGNTATLAADINWASHNLVQQDINGDAVVDYKDVLAFLPGHAAQRSKLGFAFNDIFALDVTGKSLIDYFHTGNVAGAAGRITGMFGNQLVAPTVPALVNVTPNIILPTNAGGVVAANLSVSSFVSATAQIQDSKVPNLIMAENAQGKTALLGYAMTSATVQWVIQKLGNTPATTALAAISDQIHAELSARSTALSLVMLSVGGSVNKNVRAILAARVLAHADFPALQTSIANAIAADPFFLESLGNYHGIMASIRSLAKKVLDQYLITIGTPQAIVMAHPAPAPTMFAKATGWAGKMLIKAIDAMGIREAVAAIIPALQPITPTVENNAWGGVLGLGASPWFPDQPWNWYGHVSKFNTIDPPLIAESTGTPGTFAMANPTNTNYAMEYYVNGAYVDWYLMNRNSTMIQKAFSSGAAFWKITPPSSPFDITQANHIEFHKWGNNAPEVAILSVFHILHLGTSVMSVVADATALGKLVGSAEKKIGLKGAMYQTVKNCGVSLVSTVDFSNGDAAFITSNVLSILETAVTSCVFPMANQLGKGAMKQALNAMVLKAVPKLTAKMSNPVGWAVIAFDATNDLVPLTASLLLADSHVGYDVVWNTNGTIATVTRNDATPQPGGGSVILPDVRIATPQTDATGLVTFNAQTLSLDPAGTPIYGWNFGDGAVGVGPTVTHRFAPSATPYTVTLTLTDHWNHSASAHRTYTATNGQKPVISQTSCSIDPVNNTQVHFSVTASDPNNDIASYQWYLRPSQATPAMTTTAPALPSVVLQYPASTITAFAPMVKVVDANGNVAVGICTTWQSAPMGKLNDTGITTWATATVNNLTVTQPAFPGQDADYGRDALAAQGLLTKVGGGRAGFDFTKLDANGVPLTNQAATYAVTPWSCVQDNVTGLMWEVKTTSPGLHNNNNTYTWYNSTGTNDGGSPGTFNGGTCSGSGCDTEKYVAAVNTAGLCGFADWRVPEQEDLRSIVDYNRSVPAIDTGYFPNTIINWYWTSTPHVQLPPFINYAWQIRFDIGWSGTILKSSRASVRLVRTGN